MPIVTVFALKPRSRVLLDTLPAAVATAVGCEERDVWVYVVELDAADTAGHRGTQGHCPCVTVRAAARPEAAVRAGLEAVARTVADVQGIPVEDVWAHWSTVEPGAVFAGGAIR